MPTPQTPYTSALRTFYNRVGKSYNTTTSTIHAGGPSRLVEAANLTPGSRVLDLATGTGKVAFAAAAKVGPEGHVLGIDLSEEFVSIARRSAEELGVGERVEFLQGDVGQLDLPDGETYTGRWADAVTCGSSIAMFPGPKKILDVLAARLLKPGGVFVADMWATHVPAKLFLDVAVPRGFVAPFDPLWLADTEQAFRNIFRGTDFYLQRVDKAGESQARWEAGTDEKVQELWRSLAEQQTWLSFGLEKLGDERVGEIKKSWVKELEGYKNAEGVIEAEMKQWIAVAVVKE